MSSIAFIGSVGVPNVYGGFEGFLEACTPDLARRHQVTVTCDRNRYQDHAQDWHGVKRLFLSLPANGALSVLHDFVAFLRVLPTHRNIVVLGVSGGIFFPIMRLLASLLRRRLIVNVDGVEWRRDKFGRKKKAFLKLSDTLAQTFAHEVVVDSEGLRPFLLPSRRDSAVFIAYPGDHVRLPGPAPQEDVGLLSICRIEPENNCDMKLEAFASLGLGRYTFIGNWNASAYGRDLRERFAQVPGLRLLDPVYDPEVLATLRGNCAGYIHGHSVGGTNPSLVEMLFYDAPLACFDCVFNRCTAGEDARYFGSATELADLMRAMLAGSKRGPKPSRAAYTRDAINARYEALFI
ncbi:DUF1972 domain-containing protein [Roseateles sp.]|uniref:DUF1972 domain-containing protein n=1 Tax=Roseateles sp. TaxID=1971397 RepID=UPI0031DEFDB3